MISNKTFNKIKDYIITFSIISLILLVIYFFVGAYPFGNKSIAHYDMKYQLLPFYEKLIDLLNKKDFSFHNFYNCMGENLLPALSYAIFSPFTIIIILFGRYNVANTLNLVILLKFITIGLVGLYFIKHYFNNVNNLIKISMAIMYAFSGYAMMMYTYITFLDFLIYLPLLIIAFEKLLNKNKIYPLIIILSLMICSCFALGCFSLILLLIVFCAYVNICVPYNDRKRVVVKTACAVLSAIGLTLWLIIPAFIEVLASSRNIGNTIYITKVFNNLPDKLTSVLATFIPLFFAVIYIIKCNKKDNFNKFLLACLILAIFAIISDEFISFLSGGSVFGYNDRYGYTTALLLIVLACRYFNDNTFGKKPKPFNFIILFICALLLIFMIVGFFVMYFASASIANSQSTWKIVIGLACMYALCGFAILIMMTMKHKLGKKLPILLFVASICVSSVNFYGFTYAGYTKTDSYNSIRMVTDSILDDKPVKIYGELDPYMQSLYNVNSIDIFSSLVSNNAIEIGKKLGYVTTANSIKSCGGTLLSDMIIGNKYYLTNRPLNKNNLSLINSYNNYYLYQNNLCNHNFWILDDVILTNDLIQNQQSLYQSMGGSGQLLKEYKPELSYYNITKNSNDKKLYSKNFDGYLEFEYNEVEDECLYIYYNCSNSGYLSFVKDVYVNSKKYIYELLPQDGKVRVYFNELDLNDISFYKMDISKLNCLYSYDNQIKVENNHLTLSINATQYCSIVLPYTINKGYTITLNDKHINAQDFYGLIKLDLNSGQNTIKITYQNPTYKYMLVGLSVGILIVTISLIISLSYKAFGNKFILISFALFETSLMAVYLAYPAIVTIIKMLHLV